MFLGGQGYGTYAALVQGNWDRPENWFLKSAALELSAFFQAKDVDEAKKIADDLIRAAIKIKQAKLDELTTLLQREDHWEA